MFKITTQYIKSLIVGTSLLISCTQLLMADTSIETQFLDALTAYKEARYQEATTAFHSLAFSKTPHTKISASHLMWARSLLKHQQYDQALDAAMQLIEKYPASDYTDDARYARAEAYYKLQEPINCAQELIIAIESSDDNDLIDKSQSHLRNLSLILLNDRERRTLSHKATLTSTKRIILGLDPANLAEQGIVIGVVVPMSGSDSHIGLSIKAGVEFALTQWKENHQIPVFLSVHDSRNSPFYTAQIVRDLIQLEQVSIILCAGDEGVVTACGTISDAHRIPCLILNPQTHIMTDMGELVFQLYPDRNTEGQALARYAVETLGLRTFAVLAPATDSGREMADGFVQTVKHHGGEVHIQEWFYPGSLDFEKQFTQIRQRGWDIMEAAKSDSEDVVDTTEVIKDTQWSTFIEGEVLDIEEMDAEDSLNVPVDAFDGFLIVPDSSVVNVLAPQYVFYNFDSQLIGSHDWDYGDSFQKNRNYLTGIIFSSEMFWDPARSFDQEWISDFRVTTNQSPEKYHIMGYDGMTWTLNAVITASDQPADIIDRLIQTTQFQGKGGLQMFNNRVNEAVSIIKYQRGRQWLLYP
jgi:ABC-type branched-subunit amino acid transport system substrate-binding protein